MVKVSQYADNMSLFLETQRGLELALGIVECFARGSGAQLNRAKSQMKYFGTWRVRTDALCGLGLSGGPLKILGVDFEGRVMEDARGNWEKRLAGVGKKLGLWAARRLTIIGKVLALKADIMPSLVYLARVYIMPARLRKALTRAVFKFVWGGYEYIQRVVMYQAVEEGGRDVLCFPLKCDTMFFCNICVALSGPRIHKFPFFVRFWASGFFRFLVEWDNRVPRAEVASAQYLWVVRWAKRHAECGDRELALDHRKLYRALRGKLRQSGGLRRRVEAGSVDGSPAKGVGQQFERPQLDGGVWAPARTGRPVPPQINKEQILSTSGLWGGGNRATCFGDVDLHRRCGV